MIPQARDPAKHDPLVSNATQDDSEDHQKHKLYRLPLFHCVQEVDVHPRSICRVITGCACDPFLKPENISNGADCVAVNFNSVAYVFAVTA